MSIINLKQLNIMKRILKRIAVIFYVIIVAEGSSFAQIYGSEECYYAEAGRSYPDYVVRFEGSRGVWLKYQNVSTIKSNLAKSSSYYTDETWTDGRNDATLWTYDSSKSTSSREVYSRKKYSQQLNMFGMPYDQYGNLLPSRHSGYEFVAFSKDKSSFIRWSEPLNNYDGKVENKRTYTRVPKIDLLPKSVNYDFLD